MSKKNYVEVQKGPLKDEDEHYRNMPWPRKVEVANEEARMKRGYQYPQWTEPKK